MVEHAIWHNVRLMISIKKNILSHKKKIKMATKLKMADIRFRDNNIKHLMKSTNTQEFSKNTNLRKHVLMLK